MRDQPDWTISYGQRIDQIWCGRSELFHKARRDRALGHNNRSPDHELYMDKHSMPIWHNQDYSVGQLQIVRQCQIQRVLFQARYKALK